MASETAVLRGATALVVLTVFLLFFLVNGPKGVLDAFSTLSIASGLFLLLALFIFPGGAGKSGTGVAISSVLIVGGFLAGSATGFTGIAAFLVVFSATLVFVYGLSGKNDSDKNVLLLAVAAVTIIFLGGGAIPAEASLTATGLMFLVTAFGVMVFMFSKFSAAESGLKWALSIAAIAAAGGAIFVYAGFAPALLFAVLILSAFAAAKIFPDSASGSGIISWIGTATAILVVFFMASAQGLFPGLLRGFSLLIMLSGLAAIAFFLRVGEREVPGITGSGLLLGTILTLAGLYLTLF